MKKFFLTIAGLLTMVSLMGIMQVGAAAAKPGQSTHSSAAPSAQTRQADLAKLGGKLANGNKRLSATQLMGLGLKPASRQDVARLNRMQRANRTAKTAAVGTYYWYTWHNALFSWSDRYLISWFYYSSNYFGYIVVDNWKTCTLSGTGCIDAHAYTYFYYYYYYGTWYTYGYPGFGPYQS